MYIFKCPLQASDLWVRSDISIHKRRSVAAAIQRIPQPWRVILV